MTTESPNAGTAIARYTPLEAGIAEFLAKHENVVHDVTTTKGMEAARKDRAECRGLRIRIEEARVAEKADALAYGRKVDSEAKRLTGIIAPAEDAYDLQIKAEEQRKETERQAKIEAERQRVAGIRADIEGFKRTAGYSIDKTAAEIEAVIAELVRTDPANEAQAYAEFHAEAVNAHAAALDFLRELHGKKVRAEAEAEQLRKDREELERQKKAQEQREHEAKVEREARERKEQEEREERERLARIEREAKERTEREQRQREEAERLQKIEAEEKRQAEERERLAAQQRQQDEERRRIDAERERQEQAKRDEEERIEAANKKRADDERAEKERKAAEDRRLAEAEQREQDRIAAAKKQAAEMARMLKQAKRPTPLAALLWIVEIASDDSLSDTEARKQIQVVAIANTPKEATKAAEAEAASVRG